MALPALDSRRFPLGLDSLLTQQDLAEVLGVSIRTIETWRRDGSGPSYFRLNGRLVRYRLGTVLEWASERSFSSTAEEQEAARSSREGLRMRKESRERAPPFDGDALVSLDVRSTK
jgi:phage terminase Nu1 subunit (DNA packaging protein)